MSGTYPVTMGDRGRLVIPADLRERLHLSAGAPLLAVETRRGVLLLTREQARELVREDLAGIDPLGELLRDRRAAAADDDAS